MLDPQESGTDCAKSRRFYHRRIPIAPFAHGKGGQLRESEIGMVELSAHPDPAEIAKVKYRSLFVVRRVPATGVLARPGTPNDASNPRVIRGLTE